MTQELNKDFLQKVVGFTKAVNTMMKSAEAQRSTIREAATVAVDALEKAGRLQGQDKNKLIDGFVKRPEMALKLAASLVLEKKSEDECDEDEDDKGGKSDGDADDMEEKEASLGKAAEHENVLKNKSGSAKGAAAVKESDEVWNRGFNFA